MSDEDQQAQAEEQRPRRHTHRWVAAFVLVLIAAGVGAMLAVLGGDGAEDSREAQVIAADPDDGEDAPGSSSGSGGDAEPGPEGAAEPAQSEPVNEDDPSPDAEATTSDQPAPVDREQPEREPAESDPDTESEEGASAPTEEPAVESDDEVSPSETPEPPTQPAPVAIDLGPYAMPIAGACFPEFAGQLPGAPRDYRNGIHEGVDFYPGWACTAIELGTPVLAIGEGLVIRADWEYEDLTTDLYFEMKARGFTGPGDLDTFRGRQVWVGHGGGVVARYAHLSGIAEAIGVGVHVSAGEVLGFIGESGTPGALREAGSEIHLHFELRVGEGYLGQDIGPEAALQLYRAVFPEDG